MRTAIFWSHLLTLLAHPGPTCANIAQQDPTVLVDNHDGLQDLVGLCPDYTNYAHHIHKPLSNGPLQLPFQRPHPQCRLFSSPAVEQVIEDLLPSFKDPDLAHIFRNAFPNTLDTTVLWHVDGVKSHAHSTHSVPQRSQWSGAQSFIVTGDINAEWLRDSTNQLAQYQPLAKSAPEISRLLLGAINTQAEFVIASPYCNAFQPPDPSNLAPVHSGQEDIVHPAYEPSVVFECKYELDSLANFLSLSNQYHNSTGSLEFITPRWYTALNAVLHVLNAQSQPTFNPGTGLYQRNEYTFSRSTRAGTETLNLDGIGNPLAAGTGLVRSAFRPSDDATTFGLLIPANAFMSVELARTANVLRAAAKDSKTTSSDAEMINQVAADLDQRSEAIKAGIYEHAVIKHSKYGDVFAYEVDGYGSHLLMDDANVPSLLSLPMLGFVDASSDVYQNTRRMILSRSNPYYLSGKKFSGIGGPHIGLRNAWPMSVLIQAVTSNDDEEIMDCLNRVKDISIFGLINESVDVLRGIKPSGDGMTRSWFAWANSVFAQTILSLIEKKPSLLLNTDDAGRKKYVLGQGWTG